ncbi:MAG: TIGR00282 family metallophosphoesterase [Candidatus Omnitrophica bacterium]|nr:TIGR00282 family metallophosphoesterase [Candidatus Omnitrophota bacterium]
MKSLVIGDVVGRPGREALRSLLPALKKKHRIDFIIANGENAAGGSGLTPKVVKEIFDSGVDVITSGDHIWRKKEVLEVISKENRLLRPANYPVGTPGSGFCVYGCGKTKIGVINVVGRVFMNCLEDPFLAAKRAVQEIKKETSNIFVDIHAEATSEKLALAFFLDGKVTAIFGTHTHIQTADERLFPKGTAYITDLGMTGPFDSILGRRPEQILERFITGLPTKFEMAADDVQLQGAIVEFDAENGKAISIKRLVERLK